MSKNAFKHKFLTFFNRQICLVPVVVAVIVLVVAVVVVMDHGTAVIGSGRWRWWVRCRVSWSVRCVRPGWSGWSMMRSWWSMVWCGCWSMMVRSGRMTQVRGWHRICVSTGRTVISWRMWIMGWSMMLIMRMFMMRVMRRSMVEIIVRRETMVLMTMMLVR